MLISVWFSCGAASAVAAKLTLEKYGRDHDVRIVNNPVANEHSDNQRFLKDVEAWLGVQIESAINPDYPSFDCNDVWKRAKYMEGIKGAPCTSELKKKARQYWEATNVNNWENYFLVLGFTYEETKRHENFVLTERENVIPVLIQNRMTKQDCINTVAAAGISLPEMYGLGYPNANCIGCVKATSPTYWNKIRKDFPQIFEERSQLSREIGCRLVRVAGRRLFLDELDPAVQGRPLRSLKIPDCSIFCEEVF